MGQFELLEKIQLILRKGGFSISRFCLVKPRCFDLVARRDDITLLLKAFYNIDALKYHSAREMKLIAKLLEANPIVVGEKSRESRLERGVVYSRHSIPIVNLATFYDFFLRGIYPMVYSAPGGYYVSLHGELMREIRRQKNISLGELAKKVGVSRRTIKKYEEGMDATVETALRLEEVLDTYLIKAIDVLSFRVDEEFEEPDEDLSVFDEKEKEIAESLMDIGFDVYPTPAAPFDAISRDNSGESTILTGFKDNPKAIEKRARIIGSISKVTEKKAAYIVEDPSEKSVEGTIFIKKEDLSSVSSPKDFLALLDELLSTENNI